MNGKHTHLRKQKKMLKPHNLRKPHKHTNTHLNIISTGITKRVLQPEIVFVLLQLP